MNQNKHEWKTKSQKMWIILPEGNQIINILLNQQLYFLKNIKYK